MTRKSPSGTSRTWETVLDYTIVIVVLSILVLLLVSAYPSGVKVEDPGLNVHTLSSFALSTSGPQFQQTMSSFIYPPLALSRVSLVRGCHQYIHRHLRYPSLYCFRRQRCLDLQHQRHLHLRHPRQNQVRLCQGHHLLPLCQYPVGSIYFSTKSQILKERKPTRYQTLMNA
jgi:hypothetical protein